VIVPDTRYNSLGDKESESEFLCPSDTVMTGRSHTGDENGTTTYEYASLKATLDGKTVVGKITVEDVQWETFSKAESNGLMYDAPVGRVIVGRKHSGDENGETRYATGVVKFNGHPTEIRNYAISEAKTEAGGWNWFVAPSDAVITGRHHYGDENGNTYYCYGKIYCDTTAKKETRFRVVVAMHSEERHMPMRPDDFIVLSRFRRHNDGADDDGYNKDTQEFVVGNNDHTAPYYNIPVSIINDSCLKGENVLYTLRPFNEFSFKEKELFLEPDDNLNGDMRPNGRVPAYYYSTNTNPFKVETGTIQLYMFFGYNYAEPIGEHQGDWECITIKFAEGKIEYAQLSQHANTVKYNSNELEITEQDGIQTLTVYCAVGTHALYNKAGDFTHDVVAVDHTDGLGYKWNITDLIEPLAEQPWKLFSGAWGEKGQLSTTTGPLGPWYNRGDKWVIDIGTLKLTDLIGEDEYIIVPNMEKMEKTIISNESDSEFIAPANRVIVGRSHSGDENGSTTYFHTYLQAKDCNGNIVGGITIVKDSEWSDEQKESASSGFYLAKNNRVITGRRHSGDENGLTSYQTSRIYFNGKLATVNMPKTSKSYPNIVPLYTITENLGMTFLVPQNFVMIGRIHSGDENSKTHYLIGYAHVKK